MSLAESLATKIDFTTPVVGKTGAVPVTPGDADGTVYTAVKSVVVTSREEFLNVSAKKPTPSSRLIFYILSIRCIKS